MKGIDTMKRVFLVSGPPGCGKSTWIDQQIAMFGGYHVSRDVIRFNLLKDRGGNPHYFQYENEVIKKFIDQSQECINKDDEQDVYIDATHLTNSSRNQIVKNLNLGDNKLISVCFVVPFQVCLERNEKRTGRARVPEKTIQEMFWRYNYPKQGFDEYWRIDEEGRRIK